MSFFRRLLCLTMGVELLAAAALIGWRLTRSAPPQLNLSRLPPSTASDLQSLQGNVWNDRGEAWQELGEACLAFGYCAEAEVCLRQASIRLPTRYTTRFMHAFSLERLGRLEEANQQFKTAISLGGNQSQQECLSHIGRNSLRLNNASNAEAALAACPDLPGAQVERARILARTGRAEEAIPIVESLRRNSTLDVRTEMVAVQVFRELGRFPEAEQAAEQANHAWSQHRIANPLEILEPIRTRYGLNADLRRGEELDKSDQSVAAAKVFEDVVQKTPVEFLEMVLPTGARIDLQNHHPEAALAKYEMLSQRMDPHPDVRLFRGRALAETGRMDLALKEWNRAVAAHPTTMLHRARAEAFQEQGKVADAQRELLAARFLQAEDWYRSNQLTAALHELDDLSRELPGDSRIFYCRGLVHLALDQPALAQADFQACLKIDPLHGRARDRIRDE